MSFVLADRQYVYFYWTSGQKPLKCVPKAKITSPTVIRCWCCYSSTPPIARTDSIRIDFLYRVIFTFVRWQIFTFVRWQIFTLVERGSTFSFTRDLLYIASILYTRVLSDSGNPPVIRFCAFWVSYLRLVSLPESLFSLQLILFTARPIYVTLPLSAVTPRRSWNLKLYDLQQEIVHKSAP